MHGLIFGNLAYQLLDYSENIVFRSQNLYDLQIFTQKEFKARFPDKPPGMRDGLNYVVVDPAKKNQDLEFVYWKYKTSKKVNAENYQYTSGPYKDEYFNDIGMRIIIKANSLPHKAFWLSWELVPNRRHLLVQKGDTSKPMNKGIGDLFKRFMWALDDNKVPTSQNFRTAKQIVQALTKLDKNAHKLEEQYVLAFQTVNAQKARVSYEKTDVHDDYSASYMLTYRLPTQIPGIEEPTTLMHQNPDTHTYAKYKQGDAYETEIKKKLDSITKMHTTRELEWGKLFKAPFFSPKMWN